MRALRRAAPLLERLSGRQREGASSPLLGGEKPRLRAPGGTVVVDGKTLPAKQAKGRKRKYRGDAHHPKR